MLALAVNDCPIALPSKIAILITYPSMGPLGWRGGSQDTFKLLSPTGTAVRLSGGPPSSAHIEGGGVTEGELGWK